MNKTQVASSQCMLLGIIALHTHGIYLSFAIYVMQLLCYLEEVRHKKEKHIYHDKSFDYTVNVYNLIRNAAATSIRDNKEIRMKFNLDNKTL